MKSFTRHTVRVAVAAAVVALGAVPGAASAATGLPTYTTGQLALQTQQSGPSTVTQYNASGTMVGTAQQLTSSTNCVMDQGGGGLLGFATTADNAPAQVGLRSGDIGVQTSTTSNGTACGSVDAAYQEALTVSLGGVASAGSYLFSAASLDIELKQDAAITARAYLGTNPVGEWTLTSGPTPDATCNALADSGPDAGTSDHCRWDLSAGTESDPVLFDRITLTATSGSFSLDGGSDGPVPLITGGLQANFPGADESSFFNLDAALLPGETASVTPVTGVASSHWTNNSNHAYPYQMSAHSNGGNNNNAYVEFTKPASATGGATWTTTFVEKGKKAKYPQVSFDGDYYTVDQLCTDMMESTAPYACLASSTTTKGKYVTYHLEVFGDVKLSY